MSTTQTDQNESKKPATSQEDAMVCYCYKQTTSDLKAAYAKYGSLCEVEKHTKVGTKCMGCKVLLRSIFNEEPSDSTNIDALAPKVGTSCVKPGNRVMTGFLVANGDLESTVYSSNGVAPQLGDCDSTTQIAYVVYNHCGVPIIQKQETFRTNETFVFNTRDYELPRPFNGLFELHIGRANYGGSRFNVQWSNGFSTASTHEVGSSGRPRVFVPIIVDKRFLEGETTLYVALCNSHQRPVSFKLTIYDVDDGRSITIPAALDPKGTSFINATENIYRPVFERLGPGRFVMKVETDSLDLHGAITVFFFMHHRGLNTWTANHL